MDTLDLKTEKKKFEGELIHLIEKYAKSIGELQTKDSLEYVLEFHYKKPIEL